MAGENKVSFASIEQGRSSASRLGIGAVMGDKGLKAIAVRGKRDVNIARPDEFTELCNEVLQYVQYRANEWKETQEKAVERLISCYNCLILFIFLCMLLVRS